jgi:hypothetical protein
MSKRLQMRLTMAVPRCQCGEFGAEYLAYPVVVYRARPTDVRQPVLPSQSGVCRQ